MGWLRGLHTGFPGSPLTCVLLVLLLSNVMRVSPRVSYFCPLLFSKSESSQQRRESVGWMEEVEVSGWNNLWSSAPGCCADRGGGQPPAQHPRERIQLGFLLFCTSSLLHSGDHFFPARNHEWGDGRSGGRSEVQKAHLRRALPACNLFDIIN